MSTVERPMPPLNADERTTLESWLDFHRATLAIKCEGLDDAQAATTSVPPSGVTLTGLVQHMAEVDESRRIVAARTLDDVLRYSDGSEVTMRYVLAHLIEEYARHNGHADLLRQRIDGATGE